MEPNFSVELNSLNGNAQLLLELAGALVAGRPDQDLAGKGQLASHPLIGKEIKRFSEFGRDQYLDLVALLSALSTKVQAAAARYGRTDQTSAAHLAIIDDYLQNSTYIDPPN